MIIAGWSGPRNLSTAMMYAFAARGDCRVMDEPFYASYLARTGLVHPMQAEVLAAQPQDPEAVIAACLDPGDAPLTYQKQMAHHMLPGVRRDWIAGMKNLFLIRHPARVAASYAAKRERPVLDDLGFRQQAELFDFCAAEGGAPVVVDSADIRRDPAGTLAAVCAALDIPWTPAMLCWPMGGHASDGVWAPHWYAAVHRSTGFDTAPEGDLPALDGALAEVAEQAMPYYSQLAQRRIRPAAA